MLIITSYSVHDLIVVPRSNVNNARSCSLWHQNVSVQRKPSKLLRPTWLDVKCKKNHAEDYTLYVTTVLFQQPPVKCQQSQVSAKFSG